jgi:Family of unknown function (DUF6252)
LGFSKLLFLSFRRRRNLEVQPAFIRSTPRFLLRRNDKKRNQTTCSQKLSEKKTVLNFQNKYQMTYRQFFQSLILVISGLFLTCKQPVDFLPPATQTGQNTLGCLIDGKPHIPDGGPAFSGTRPIVGGRTGRFHGPGSGFIIYTFSRSEQYLHLYLDDCAPGMHLLNTGDPAVGVVTGRLHRGQYSSVQRGYLLTSTKHTGWVNLTKVDTVSGVVSGTFEFTAANPAGETVSITNGRFDLNPRTQ